MAEEKEKGYRTIWPGLLLLTLLLVSIPFFDIFWPSRLTLPSPTGQYTLEQRYLDMMGWGYRGRTYLLAKGRYYKIDDVGPGYADWIDEERFSVYGEIYAVSDFVAFP